MAGGAAGKKSKHHALAIPVPGQGHVNPLMRFCRRLAAQKGFTITFLDILPSYDPELATQLRQRDERTTQDGIDVPLQDEYQGLDIRKAHMAMPHLTAKGDAGRVEQIFETLHSLTPQIEELLLQLLHQDPPISCLISDMLMTQPTQCVADKYNLPRIALYTSCQSLLVFKNYILGGVVPLEEVIEALEARNLLKDKIFKEELHGLPPLKVRDLFDCPGENQYIYTYTLKALEETKSKAHAMIVNSFEELEGNALKVPIGIPVYGIGPLVESLGKETNTSFWKEDEACMLWLDLQPPSSVLFISFGSLASLTKAQFEELVAGLLSSQQRFLWVFRTNLVKDASSSTILEDLLSRSHGRGYVTHWVPQISVLSHPSIHGFLTHCGWNSTVEAISKGIPMICFPFFSDQFIDARLISEEWKVGLCLKENKETGLVGRKEVENAVLTLLAREEGAYLHVNAKLLQKACDESFAANGYGSKNIEDLVESLDKKVFG